MLLLEARSIGPVWVEYMNATLEHGVWTYDDREEVLESPPIIFSISDFDDHEGILRRHGVERVIDIYVEKMFSMDLIEELNSTYGDRLFSNRGVDQIDLAVKKLSENPWAKSCFVPLVTPDDPGPRVPCLSAIQFAVRNERLQIYATFRSQNVFNSYGNFLGIRELQIKVSEMLKIEPGTVNFFVNFPHIYRSDVKQAKAILAEEN